MGCTSTILQIYAVDRLNLADASVIVFSSPVFVTLFAHCFLGEKAGMSAVLIAVLTFAGVVVISRPPILTGQSHMDEETLVRSYKSVIISIYNSFWWLGRNYLCLSINAIGFSCDNYPPVFERGTL